MTDWIERDGLATRGNTNLLAQHKFTALYCSVRCPGDLILKTYDLTRSLRQAGTPVAADSTLRWRKSAYGCCCEANNRSLSARLGGSRT